MNKLLDEILDISDSIRYVAIYQGNILITKQRNSLTDTSASESDKYEELFVNPTILKIAGQRGNLDCGGLDYIIIKYGNFYQMISDYRDGHFSICIDKLANPIKLQKSIRDLLNSYN